MIKNFIIKNWKVIFNIQLGVFTVFIILTFIYYWDKPAHQYFNRNLDTVDSQAIFSLLMTYLFVLFIILVLLYPILFLIQIFSMRNEKRDKKMTKLLLLFVLYVLTIISIFALYTIHSSHAIPATIDNKPNQSEIVNEEKSEIPYTGFIVLKNTYNQQNELTIYNLDQSKWKSFYFDDKFKYDDIDPYAIKPENTLLVFKCLGKENEFYKVIVNENKNTIKYIKESNSNFKFETIEVHILTVFSVDFNEKENPLRLAPD